MAERAGAVKSILIRPAVRVFDPILRCLMLMAAVAPLAVTQNVIQLDHDDAWSPYQASAGCATAAGSRRTRLAPPGRVPVLS